MNKGEKNVLGKGMKNQESVKEWGSTSHTDFKSKAKDRYRYYILLVGTNWSFTPALQRLIQCSSMKIYISVTITWNGNIRGKIISYRMKHVSVHHKSWKNPIIHYSSQNSIQYFSYFMLEDLEKKIWLLHCQVVP